MNLPRALLTAAHTRLSALMASSHSESLFEAVLIAEAELASEAGRPNPRRNQTSGLEFVIKTAPWRPGDLS